MRKECGKANRTIWRIFAKFKKISIYFNRNQRILIFFDFLAETRGKTCYNGPMQERLLQWYDENKRDLPWRAHARSLCHLAERGDAATDARGDGPGILGAVSFALCGCGGACGGAGAGGAQAVGRAWLL